MTAAEQPRSSGLFARVQAILFRPSAEWDVIAAEPATVQGLYTGYACILAAIPVLAQLIGGQVFGYGVFVFHYRPPIVAAVVTAIVDYVVSLGLLYVIALIIDALAPSFEGQKDRIQALKVAVYSYTAAWVAGVFLLIPVLSILALVGLYSLYLLYRGLPRLMKAPESKALAYTAVSVICAIVVSVVVLVIVNGVLGAAGLTAMGLGGFRTASVDHGAAQVHINGANIDVGKMQAAAAALQRGEANSKQIVAINPDLLKGLLPASVAGLPRTDVESSSGGVGGWNASSAEATYQKDQARITVRVADIAAAGALAGMASAMNVNADKETATGYEKVGMVGGRMTSESWDNASKTGKYSIVVANRFAVDAEGENEPMDALKAAVAAVDAGRLEGMARS
ncbi:MAG TPA: Yip1 family protein [Caulobacteraceae bacterium]|nr:Yip1 family protein [Caulobacteraceae bacterium]